MEENFNLILEISGLDTEKLILENRLKEIEEHKKRLNSECKHNLLVAKNFTESIYCLCCEKELKPEKVSDFPEKDIINIDMLSDDIEVSEFVKLAKEDIRCKLNEDYMVNMEDVRKWVEDLVVTCNNERGR